MGKIKQVKKGPQIEGVDPLTKGERLVGDENVQEESVKARAESAKVNVDQKAQDRKKK